MKHASMLRSVLDRAEVGVAAAEAIVASARPAVAMSLSREGDERRIPVGTSKVGGGADLPRGEAWPQVAGLNMRFLAQINLAEVGKFLDAESASMLPRAGLLSFFWAEEYGFGSAPEKMGGARVMYTAPAMTLVRAGDPWSSRPERVGLLGRLFGKKASARGQGFWPCQVTFSSKLTLPDPFGPRGVAKDLLSDAEFDDVFGGGLEDELGEAGVLLGGHRLLGEAAPIQGAVEYEAESESVGPSAKTSDASEAASAEWRLLLQIDSDDGPGFCFGDWGAVYFMMRRADLAANRWDQVRAVMQCH